MEKMGVIETLEANYGTVELATLAQEQDWTLA